MHADNIDLCMIIISYTQIYPYAAFIFKNIIKLNFFFDLLSFNWSFETFAALINA